MKFIKAILVLKNIKQQYVLIFNILNDYYSYFIFIIFGKLGSQKKSTLKSSVANLAIALAFAKMKSVMQEEKQVETPITSIIESDTSNEIKHPSTLPKVKKRALQQTSTI